MRLSCVLINSAARVSFTSPAAADIAYGLRVDIADGLPSDIADGLPSENRAGCGYGADTKRERLRATATLSVTR